MLDFRALRCELVFEMNDLRLQIPVFAVFSYAAVFVFCFLGLAEVNSKSVNSSLKFGDCSFPLLDLGIGNFLIAALGLLESRMVVERMPVLDVFESVLGSPPPAEYGQSAIPRRHFGGVGP